MVCAVQHEPPRVSLTAHPNPRPALGMEPTSTSHPRMGHPAVPAASPAFGVLQGIPNTSPAMGSIPGVAAAGPAAARAARMQRIQD